jgi:hypothetical protein
MDAAEGDEGLAFHREVGDLDCMFLQRVAISVSPWVMREAHHLVCAVHKCPFQSVSAKAHEYWASVDPVKGTPYLQEVITYVHGHRALLG